MTSEAVLLPSSESQPTDESAARPAEHDDAPSVFRRRLTTWASILAAYFGAQTLTQLLGIAAGLVFVRWMPLPEFALYTLGSSVITFLAFTTDLGSTASLVHFYRRSREEGDRFESYLEAVLSLRRLAFLVAAGLVAVGFPVVALGKGFSTLDVTLATGAILLAVWLQIGASVRVLALRLGDRYGQSYRAELAGAGLRLVLALALLGAALLRSWLGLLVAAAGSALTSWTARASRMPVLPDQAGARSSSRHRKAVARYLLPTLPSALYFSLQGPLVVWLAATFGASKNIAEVGALGRLGLVVGIFGSLTSVVFVPRLARVTDEALWRRRALQFGAVQASVGATLLAAAAVAPAAFLWLIGAQYSGLDRELLLVVAASALTLVSGHLVSVNLSRGWNRLQSPAMVILAGTQALMVAVIALDTTAGALTFNALSAVVGLALQAAIFVVGCKKPEWAAVA